MINVVIPMAGAGSRFVKAGYDIPKPFIDVLGVPMVERVLINLSMPGARYILIARSDHLERGGAVLERIKETYSPEIVVVDQLTEGAACTVLLAVRLLNDDTPLLIANSDQIVDMNIADYVGDSRARGLDGSILTFPSDHPKWSYVKHDEQGLVTEIKEKVVISEKATVGIYYFERGSDFVECACEMIANNDRVNNEFYVCPAYAYGIRHGLRIGSYHIPEHAMHGMGVPEDLDEYVALLNEKELSV